MTVARVLLIGMLLAFIPPDGAVAQVRADGRDVTYPKLIADSKVLPVYPRRALTKGVEAVVILEAVITKQGTVTGVKVLRAGVPGLGLEEAAIKAVKKWRYEPGLADGAPVDVYFTIVVEFSLSGRSAVLLRSRRWKKTMAYAAELDDLARPRLAIEQLRLAAEIAKKYRDMRRVLTLEKLAELLISVHETDEAMDVLETLVVTRKRVQGPSHPQVASTQLMIAGLQLDQGQEKPARTNLDHAGKLLARAKPKEHPDLPQLLTQHAALLERVGESNLAIDTLQRAAEIQRVTPGEEHPAFAATLIRIARLQEQQGQEAAARTNVQHAGLIFMRSDLADNPLPPDALEEYAALEELFGNAIGAATARDRAWKSRCLLSHRSSDYSVAVGACGQAVDAYPEDAGSWGRLGHSLGENGKPTKAVEALRKALELEPGSAWALQRLGYVLATGLSNRPAALDAYRQAVAADSESASNLNAIAWNLATLPALRSPEVLDEALELILRACVLSDRMDAKILDTLAEVHHWRGEVGKALEAIDEAIQLQHRSKYFRDQRVRFQAGTLRD